MGSDNGPVEHDQSEAHEQPARRASRWACRDCSQPYDPHSPRGTWGTEQIRRQQVGMSNYDHNISPDAETRREGARQSDGRFGPQEHSEPAGGTDALVPTSEPPQFTMDGFYDETTDTYTHKFDAFSYGNPWNGFATPVVTRQTTDALLAAFDADEDAMVGHRWDGDNLHVWNNEGGTPEQDAEDLVVLTPDANGNYDLAPLGMVFEEVEDDNPEREDPGINDAARNPGCPKCGLLDASRNVDGSWGPCEDCQADEDGYPRHSTTRDRLVAAARRPEGVPGVREYLQRTGRKLVRPFLATNGAYDAHLVQRVDTDGLRMLVTDVDGQEAFSDNVKDEDEAVDRFGELFGTDPVAKQEGHVARTEANLRADESRLVRTVERNRQLKVMGGLDSEDIENEQQDREDIAAERKYLHQEAAYLARMQSKVQTLEDMSSDENPYTVHETTIFPHPGKDD